jgi:hypothetical protein
MKKIKENMEKQKKQTDIYKAIKNLPDNLITTEIWEAAIEEGQIQILNVLPAKYLTEENINKVLDKNTGYSWESFKLSSIPEQCRTQKICDAAVGKSLENYLIVPDDKKTNDMLLEIMGSAERYIHFLPSVPEATWDENAVYKGIRSIYNSGSSNNRYYSSASADKETQMKLIQILLAYVPEPIKTKPFYFGLFSLSMNVMDINFLVPNKFLKTDYYLEMAKKSIKYVPVEKLNYETIKAALLSENNHETDFWGGWNCNSKVKEPMLELMDAEMADIVIGKWPTKLSEIPVEFQTKSRLIAALNSRKEGSRDADRIYGSFDIKTFDDDICRAIVRQEEYTCPEFAPEIWTQDFVDYCIENASSFYWFKQMPKELQTQEIVNKAMDASIRNIKYVETQFISYETAVTVFRYCNSWDKNKHEYREHTPKHYLDDFNMETGLPREFFGGETTYSKLKDGRDNYKYCQIGECYIGFFIDKDGRDEYNRLVMTRRTPMQIRPSIIFSRTIGTFHKTWLEKLVADNDPQFAKPQVEKGLKGKQVNLYMGVRFLETYEDEKIYAHSFLGETVMYTADYMERSTLDKIRQAITDAQKKEVDIAC